MAKMIMVAQVEDLVRWEEGFRSHADLFRSYSITKPIAYGGMEDNYVAVCYEPDDMATLLKGIGYSMTVEAMKADGLKVETVKMFVLNKEFEV
jgi:hypothetical protein